MHQSTTNIWGMLLLSALLLFPALIQAYPNGAGHCVKDMAFPSGNFNPHLTKPEIEKGTLSDDNVFLDGVAADEAVIAVGTSPYLLVSAPDDQEFKGFNILLSYRDGEPISEEAIQFEDTDPYQYNTFCDDDEKLVGITHTTNDPALLFGARLYLDQPGRVLLDVTLVTENAGTTSTFYYRQYRFQVVDEQDSTTPPDAQEPTEVTIFTCPSPGDDSYSDKPTLDAMNDAVCGAQDTNLYTALTTDTTVSPECTTYCASCEEGFCQENEDRPFITCLDPEKCTICSDPPGCNEQEPTAVDDNSVMGVLKQQPLEGDEGYSTLVYLLERTGLDEILSDLTATYTLLAPNNKAFDQLDRQVFADWQNDSFTAHLRDGLSRHVLDQVLDSTTQLASVQSLSGEYISFLSPSIDQRATVITPDLAAENGLVHGIDTVLRQPNSYYTIKEYLEFRSDQYSILLKFLNAVPDFSTPMTLFAPNNLAWEFSGLDLNALIKDPEALEPILLAHMANNNFPTASLAQMNSLRMNDGLTQDLLMFGDSLAIGTATVDLADIFVKDGMVQGITAVLQKGYEQATPEPTEASGTTPAPTMAEGESPAAGPVDLSNLALGDSVTHEGYVLDQYCINQGVFLDQPDLASLENPDKHTVHCLIDAPPCIAAPFELLQDPAEGEVAWTRAFVFNEGSKNQVVALAKSLGGPACTECDGTGTLEAGFRILVEGRVTALADATTGVPATLSITSLEAAGMPPTTNCPVPDPATQCTLQSDPHTCTDAIGSCIYGNLCLAQAARQTNCVRVESAGDPADTLPTVGPTNAGMAMCDLPPPVKQTFSEVPITLTYKLGVDEATGMGTFSAEVVYAGLGWVGFGISPNGMMMGSLAVIGVPDEPVSQTNPGKYNLDQYAVSGVLLADTEQQTLLAGKVEQNETHTTLTFTKFLTEPGELAINPSGDNFFLVAAGSGNELAYHAVRHSFTETLNCPSGGDGPTMAPSMSRTADSPTRTPSDSPTVAPSMPGTADSPTQTPSDSPTVAPSMPGTADSPTPTPSDSPTVAPSMPGTADSPTRTPSDSPTISDIEPVIFITDSCTEITWDVGDHVAVTGFIMDNFCIERGTLLDAPTVATLEEPDRHSLHCLIDVEPCAESNYEVLLDPGICTNRRLQDEGSSLFTRGFVLDDAGKALIRDLAKEVGVCDSCDGTGDWEFGFRARVQGTVTALGTDGEPPVISVQMATPVTFDGTTEPYTEAPALPSTPAPGGAVDCTQFQVTYLYPGTMLTLEYVMVVDEATGEGNYTGRVTYEGQGWVGFAVSPDGSMKGSEAIIGLPDQAVGEGNPGVYDLNGKFTAGVVLADSARQSILLQANIVQNDTHTEMTFVRTLAGQVSIVPNEPTFFLAASGSGNDLAIHNGRGSLEVVATPCTAGTGDGIGDDGLVPGTEDLVFFSLQYEFEEGRGRDLTQEDVEDLICQTNRYFSDRLQTFTGDNTMQSEAMYIDWSYDADLLHSLTVNFTANGTNGDGLVPQDTVLDALDVTMDDIMYYIEYYVWSTNQGNVFQQTISVNFTDEAGALAPKGRLETATCPETQAPTGTPTISESPLMPSMMETSSPTAPSTSAPGSGETPAPTGTPTTSGSTPMPSMMETPSSTAPSTSAPGSGCEDGCDEGFFCSNITEQCEALTCAKWVMGTPEEDVSYSEEPCVAEGAEAGTAFCGWDGNCYTYGCENWFTYGPFEFTSYDPENPEDLVCSDYADGAEENMNSITFGCRPYQPGNMAPQSTTWTHFFNQECLASPKGNDVFRCYQNNPNTDYRDFQGAVARLNLPTCDTEINQNEQPLYWYIMQASHERGGEVTNYMEGRDNTLNSDSFNANLAEMTFYAVLVADGEPQQSFTRQQINARFIVSNMEGIVEPAQVNSSGLAAAWPPFVEEVVQDTMAESQLRLLRENTSDRGRRLRVEYESNSAYIYEIELIECEAGSSPDLTCHTASGTYSLLLYEDSQTSAIEIEQRYGTATVEAIDDGKFDETLEQVEPDSPLNIGTMTPPTTAPSAADATGAGSGSCELLPPVTQTFSEVPITLTYELGVEEATGRGTFSAEVIYEGQGWVGFGFSPDGKMVGSLAVIGLPDEPPDKLTNPGKYNLVDYAASGVLLADSEQQTLLAGNIVQNDTHTMLSFTKFLEESDEVAINPNGDNFFLVAAGVSNSPLVYHAVRHSFKETLNCPSGGDVPTMAPSMSGTADSPTRTPSDSPTVAPSMPGTADSPTRTPSDSPTVMVNTSFVLANQKGLGAEQLASPEYSTTLIKAFDDFVVTLVENMESNQTQRFLRAARRLLATLQPNSTKILGVQNANCPNDVDQGSSCQNTFGEFNLLVTNENTSDVSSRYDAAVDTAITEGKLQESIDKVDPNYPWKVVGVVETDKTQKEEKDGKMSWWLILLIVLASVCGCVGFGCLFAYSNIKRREKSLLTENEGVENSAMNEASAPLLGDPTKDPVDLEEEDASEEEAVNEDQNVPSGLRDTSSEKTSEDWDVHESRVVVEEDEFDSDDELLEKAEEQRTARMEQAPSRSVTATVEKDELPKGEDCYHDEENANDEENWSTDWQEAEEEYDEEAGFARGLEPSESDHVRSDPPEDTHGLEPPESHHSSGPPEDDGDSGDEFNDEEAQDSPLLAAASPAPVAGQDGESDEEDGNQDDPSLVASAASMPRAGEEEKGGSGEVDDEKVQERAPFVASIPPESVDDEGEEEESQDVGGNEVTQNTTALFASDASTPPDGEECDDLDAQDRSPEIASAAGAEQEEEVLQHEWDEQAPVVESTPVDDLDGLSGENSDGEHEQERAPVAALARSAADPDHEEKEGSLEDFDQDDYMDQAQQEIQSAASVPPEHENREPTQDDEDVRDLAAAVASPYAADTDREVGDNSTDEAAEDLMAMDAPADSQNEKIQEDVTNEEPVEPAYTEKNHSENDASADEMEFVSGEDAPESSMAALGPLDDQNTIEHSDASCDEDEEYGTPDEEEAMDQVSPMASTPIDQQQKELENARAGHNEDVQEENTIESAEPDDDKDDQHLGQEDESREDPQFFATASIPADGQDSEEFDESDQDPGHLGESLLDDGPGEMETNDQEDTSLEAAPSDVDAIEEYATNAETWEATGQEEAPIEEAAPAVDSVDETASNEASNDDSNASEESPMMAIVVPVDQSTETREAHYTGQEEAPMEAAAPAVEPPDEAWDDDSDAPEESPVIAAAPAVDPVDENAESWDDHSTNQEETPMDGTAPVADPWDENAAEEEWNEDSVDEDAEAWGDHSAGQEDAPIDAAAESWEDNADDEAWEEEDQEDDAAWEEQEDTPTMETDAAAVDQWDENEGDEEAWEEEDHEDEEEVWEDQEETPMEASDPERWDEEEVRPSRVVDLDHAPVAAAPAAADPGEWDDSDDPEELILEQEHNTLVLEQAENTNALANVGVAGLTSQRSSDSDDPNVEAPDDFWPEYDATPEAAAMGASTNNGEPSNADIPADNSERGRPAAAETLERSDSGFDSIPDLRHGVDCEDSEGYMSPPTGSRSSMGHLVRELDAGLADAKFHASLINLQDDDDSETERDDGVTELQAELASLESRRLSEFESMLMSEEEENDPMLLHQSASSVTYGSAADKVNWSDEDEAENEN